MGKVIYVSVINPCFSCGCTAYDPDMGCTMPSSDLFYACPLEPDLDIKAEESEDMEIS